jgi:hypothetical protein
VLRHSFGEAPYYRACAIAGVAATLSAADTRSIALVLAAVAGAIASAHDFVMPPWLSVAVSAPGDALDLRVLTVPDAVAMALTFDES